MFGNVGIQDVRARRARVARILLMYQKDAPRRARRVSQKQNPFWPAARARRRALRERRVSQSNMLTKPKFFILFLFWKFPNILPIGFY